MSHQLLASYFTSSQQLPCSSLLSHFSQWLLASVGDGPDERWTPSGDQSPWQVVERLVNEKMVGSVPALGLFCDPLEISQKKTEPRPPSINTSTISLHEYKPIVAYGLHLVYEVCKRVCVCLFM